MNKFNKFLSLCFQFICALMIIKNSFAADDKFTHPFYVGATGGYGATTWAGLVPNKDNQNLAMSLSTPIKVTEGGAIWGAFGGYEFNKFFALEASYNKYQDAKIEFDEISIFNFEHDGLTEFTTRTETVTLIGKVMLVIPKTDIRLFSSTGVAAVRRQDIIYNDWKATPTFGAGLNYNITPRIMTEFGANYTAGYGEAQLSPTDSYLPFLYSVFFRLGLRF